MRSEKDDRLRGAPATGQLDRGLADASDSHGRGWHALLRANGFYPVAACSALGVAMVLARGAIIGERGFLFMIWNLFLAWLPFAFALPLAVLPARRGHGWRLLPLFAAWLLFLPNAPYMVTDLLHLRGLAGSPYWYDATLLFVFAWTGCLLGFHSMAIVHRRVEAWLGRFAGWTFVATAALLTGFGIYLGRFLRWNSWDAVTRPGALLEDVAERLLQPRAHPQTWAVTLLFGAFVLAAYGSFRRPAR